MAISYDKLWKLLIDKKIKKTDLRNSASLTTNTLAKLGKGEVVDMQSLLKICDAMNCSLSDIVEYTPDKKAGEQNA
jgi:DNA (cytosine-5)-methyltransferase 1